MERFTGGAEVVAKVLWEIVAILFSPHRLERSRRNTPAWTRTTRSGARSWPVDSVACAVAVRVVDDAGVEEGDAEAAARSGRAMERCTRGAEVIANVLFWTCPFFL